MLYHCRRQINRREFNLTPGIEPHILSFSILSQAYLGVNYGVLERACSSIKLLSKVMGLDKHYQIVIVLEVAIMPLKVSPICIS
jgi:hypothetical protein